MVRAFDRADGADGVRVSESDREVLANRPNHPRPADFDVDGNNALPGCAIGVHFSRNFVRCNVDTGNYPG